MNRFTVSIQGHSLKDMRSVGGKALPLMQLSGKKIPVPPGFILTTEAYRTFIQENRFEQNIRKAVARTSSLEQIRHKILRAPLPEGLEQEIEGRIREFRIQRYAVRSSANVEDSKKTSWAGIFESSLNVPPKNIGASIRTCWASLFTPRALEYAKEARISLEDIAMAVIVQESIQSTTSGVCFTRNPLDLEDDTVSIEAIFGLGELLVQGDIIPDRYTIERKTGIILEVVCNEQKHALYGKRVGGITYAQVRNSRDQKLQGKEISQLATLAIAIEAIHKSPRDIEWCTHNDKLYILQSRPITA